MIDELANSPYPCKARSTHHANVPTDWL